MVMTQSAPDKLTYLDAAAKYGVSVDTIRNWVARGYINKYSKPLDKRKYVSVAEIDTLRSAEPSREDGE